MRKFTILGLGAISTVAIAFGPASPASAVVVPTPITDEVCAAVPTGLLDVVSGLAANLLLSNPLLGTGLLDIAMVDATDDLSVATDSLVDSLVAHIGALDGELPTTATSAAVVTSVSDYADAAAAWTQAAQDLDAAAMQARVLDLQQSVLEDIGLGLACV